MLRSLLIGTVLMVRDQLRLPAARLVFQEQWRVRQRAIEPDPGLERAVTEVLAWLGRAQDHSTSHDGGVARHYSLQTGWAPSYPETTGYIIPTLLDCALRFKDDSLRERARRMLDWLVSIQMPGGGFQGGMIGQTPVVPVTFNTGQILIGLAAGVASFGNVYLDPMRAAADWLVDTQDPDGAWRRHATPFAAPGEKAYETHVAWGLLEAARIDPDPTLRAKYATAALHNVRWALTKQHANGWFADCDLSNPEAPLTHTIGYVLRGVLEAYRYTEDHDLLTAARRTADSLAAILRDDGYLPGRLDAHWNGTVPWACLTGIVQIAHCWLLLYQIVGEPRYRDAAYAANRYVRGTVRVDNTPDECRGGVKGSHPISGHYGQYEYLNWAAKFFIDSHLLEQDIRQSERAFR